MAARSELVPPVSGHRAPAYQWGAVALLAAAVTILGALAFEYVGGYKPCPLCLEERWAYYAAMPLLFAALTFHSMDWRRIAQAIFVLVALAFLANAVVGVYHAGAEWKFWPGPETCTGTPTVGSDAGSLLSRLQTVHVIRCDEAALRILGISLAGWNAVISFALMIACLKAATAAGTSNRTFND